MRLIAVTHTLSSFYSTSYRSLPAAMNAAGYTADPYAAAIAEQDFLELSPPENGEQISFTHISVKANGARMNIFERAADGKNWTHRQLPVAVVNISNASKMGRYKKAILEADFAEQIAGLGTVRPHKPGSKPKADPTDSPPAP